MPIGGPNKTPQFASAVGSAGEALTVALPTPTQATVFLKSILITCAEVAAVVSGLITVTGLAHVLNFEFVETVSAGGYLSLVLDDPLPEDGAAAITVNVPAIAGGSAVAVNIFGYSVPNDEVQLL